MAKFWTMSDDIFLLTHHRNVCPNYIASHDLGRPHGAGALRFNMLTRSGARLELSRAQLHICNYKLESNLARSAFDREVVFDFGQYWRAEIAELEKARA
jgi:hypothetical protein